MREDGFTSGNPAAAPETVRFGRNYRLLWAATAAANLADGVTLAAGPLLAASITRDPLLVSGLVVAQRLPWFLFTLPSGALVDRLDRRRIMMAANLLRAGGLAVLALSLVADTANLAVLYAAVFALGVSETFVDNASLAVLPAVVRRDDLDAANGRIFATQSVMNQLVGPPLGSWLFAVAIAIPFGGAAIAFTSAAVLLRGMQGVFRTDPGADADQPMAAQIRDGLRWFWANRVIRVVAVMAGVINFFGAATMGVFVLVAQERLGVSDTGYGIVLAAAAVGGILGGWAAERIIRRIGWGPAIFGMITLPALCYVGIALTSSAVVASLMLALDSFAGTIGNVVVAGLRQTAIPDHLLGRVTSAYRLFGLGALPLGGAFGGVTADLFGLTAPFWIGAAGLAAMALLVVPVLTTDAITRARQGGSSAGGREEDRQEPA
jgi:MFS family permease